VNLSMGSTHRVICAGELLYLAAGVRHELAAIKNSSLLVTLVLLSPSGISGVTGDGHGVHGATA